MVKELIDAYPLNEPLYIVVVVVVHALNLPREVVLVLVVLQLVQIGLHALGDLLGLLAREAVLLVVQELIQEVTLLAVATLALPHEHLQQRVRQLAEEEDYVAREQKGQCQVEGQILEDAYGHFGGRVAVGEDIEDATRAVGVGRELEAEMVNHVKNG